MLPAALILLRTTFSNDLMVFFVLKDLFIMTAN